MVTEFLLSDQDRRVAEHELRSHHRDGRIQSTEELDALISIVESARYARDLEPAFQGLPPLDHSKWDELRGAAREQQRASDADRSRTRTLLDDAHRSGRLDDGEHRRRDELAASAATPFELERLLVGIPARHGPRPTETARQQTRARLDTAYQQQQITQADYDRRVALIVAASTPADLRAVVADLDSRTAKIAKRAGDAGNKGRRVVSSGVRWLAFAAWFFVSLSVFLIALILGVSLLVPAVFAVGTAIVVAALLRAPGAMRRAATRR